MAIKLIIGLRNPGSVYEHTRHNAGAWLINSLASHHRAQFKIDKKLQSEITDCVLENTTCKLLLPLTFMNHSGQPIRLSSQFYRILPEEILVVHDELDLPAGRIKLKSGGGHGGHNGLRDSISHLGSNQFHRLRIGIGHPGHKDLVHQYVLQKPSQQDKLLIYDAIERAVSLMSLICSDLSKAMNQLNS